MTILQADMVTQSDMYIFLDLYHILKAVGHFGPANQFYTKYLLTYLPLLHKTIQKLKKQLKISYKKTFIGV